MTIVVFEDDVGDGWAIQDTHAGHVIESQLTQQQAIDRARNTWAAPGQPIFVRSNGRIRTIREGRDDWATGLQPTNPSSSRRRGGLLGRFF